MFRSIGHGHQPVAQLSRPTLCCTQGSLLIVVFSAGIHVFLAVAQHRIDEPGQLVGRGGDGLGRSHLCLLPAQEGAQGAAGAVQGVGRQTQGHPAARLALGLVLELMTLPTVMRLFGLSPNQDAKCFALVHFVMSVPILLTTLSAV